MRSVVGEWERFYAEIFSEQNDSGVNQLVSSGSEDFPEWIVSTLRVLAEKMKRESNAPFFLILILIIYNKSKN